MKKILEQLTKITDLTILFATIFVFLAYITPEGISESSINNLRTNAQTIATSLSLAEEQAANANTRLQESNSFSNDLRSSISELEAQVKLIDPTIDQISIDELGAEINELNTGLTNNESVIDIAQRDLQTANNNVQSLREKLRAAEQEVADLEAELGSSRSISWIQPVRQNTDKLINAAGFDGFIAGFSALIFCLVVKRRRDWFRRMFGLYFK